jgi:hypothetical protein
VIHRSVGSKDHRVHWNANVWGEAYILHKLR